MQPAGGSPFPIIVPRPPGQAPTQQPVNTPAPTQVPPAVVVPPASLVPSASAVPPASEEISAIQLPMSLKSINATNAMARVGRPGAPVRNRLLLNAAESKVFLSAPVNLTIELEAGEEVASVPLNLEYDKQLLRLISASSGGLLAIDGQKEDLQVDLNKGEIRLKRPDGSGGVSGNGTLLKLTFATLAKGEAAIRIVSADMANGRKEPLTGSPLPEILVTVQ
jgi:hypothetical protein